MSIKVKHFARFSDETYEININYLFLLRRQCLRKGDFNQFLSDYLSFAFMNVVIVVLTEIYQNHICN